jgi:diguanylate cyclase (GGDEF)-like protein/PAS domain S-box-containing protein
MRKSLPERQCERPCQRADMGWRRLSAINRGPMDSPTGQHSRPALALTLPRRRSERALAGVNVWAIGSPRAQWVNRVWNLYETVVLDHDKRFVALAVAICALGSLTGVAIVQHALRPRNEAFMSGWLLLAGLVTGLCVWTTHFTAMLGYRADLDIKFDLVVASASFLLSMPIAIAGWWIGFRKRERGLVGGTLVGASIAVAHFMDMQAIRIAGIVDHNHAVSSVALFLALAFGAASGHLLSRHKSRVVAWPAAVALFAAVVTLHFIAMSGVTIDAAHFTPLIDDALTATANELAYAVVLAFLILLVSAVAVTWHSQTLARATAEKNARLIQALENLRQTQDHHRAYVELNPQIAWVADPRGKVTEIAPLWEKLVGIPCEEGLGDGWARAVHPEDLPAITALWKEAIRTGREDRADARYRIRLADGSYRWFRVRGRPRRDEGGNVIAWYGSLEDIHKQVLAETALRESEERYRLASRATNDVIWDWSWENRRASWAGAYKKVLGYPELGSGTDLDWWRNRIHRDDLARVLASQTSALESGSGYWNEEYRFLVASGQWIDVRSRCVIVRDDAGLPVRLVGSMLDITQQKKAEAELNWAAFHDPLTRLPNRALYRSRIHEAIDTARGAGRYVALVTLDLNSFKELNDTLGHAAGDRVLEETARRLTTSLPGNSTVARLGGDEFAILLPDLAEVGAYEVHLRTLAQCLIDPVGFGAMRIPISYCGGVAIWPRDAADPGELLIAADLALYAAKAGMHGTIREFSPSLKQASERRARMLAAARSALKENRILPFYQPKVDLQTGQIMGCEALLRIRSEDGVIQSPAEIEAAFADPDITVQITDRMLAQMFADLANWRAAGLEAGRIAVNVAAGDFRQHNLAERLKGVAELHSLDLRGIDIEVTETVLIGQLGPEVSRMLEELRKLGVMVALDDFGTGYASLTHLQQFPVDVIKIDRSFIERIDEHDPKATAVIDAVLQMARRLGMQTVAEGIETREQARYLRARGCTIGQGYFFSRPVSASAMAEILAAPTYHGWEFGSARTLS